MHDRQISNEGRKSCYQPRSLRTRKTASRHGQVVEHRSGRDLLGPSEGRLHQVLPGHRPLVREGRAEARERVEAELGHDLTKQHVAAGMDKCKYSD